jgi:hypothetical protein
MVKKVLLVLMVFWLAILVLMPKQELYYKLEEVLDQYEVRLNEAEVSEGLFSLTLKEVNVYVKDIKVATIEEVSLFSLLFYSSMDLQSLRVDDSLKNMVPEETKTALLRHSILSPEEVSVEASGSFGSLSGKIDLNARQIHLDFNESKELQMLKPALKKSEKGWVYETSF